MNNPTSTTRLIPFRARTSYPLASGLLMAIALLAACDDSSTTGPALQITVQAPAGTLLVGDQVELQATLSDPTASGTLVWSSSDTAVALVGPGGHLWAQRPGTATISARLGKASGETALTVMGRPGGYTAEEIDYLQEIAFGFETGSASQVIRKWAANPKVRINGIPTVDDLATVNTVVLELNALMEEVQVELVESDASVEVHIQPISLFPSILPSYVQGNWGYFTVWFSNTNEIFRSVVLLASDVADQTERNHLAREEITQMLGLARDSYRYSTSIFQQDWTTTQSYADIDKALIEMLYRPQLRPGMGYREAVDVLRTLTRRGFGGDLAPVRMVETPDRSAAPDRTGTGGTGAGGELGPVGPCRSSPGPCP